jgi:Protein required for attachment to host cells
MRSAGGGSSPASRRLDDAQASAPAGVQHGSASERDGRAMKLSEGMWVVVTDGTRRLVLENRAKGPTLDLRVRESAQTPAARTADLGTGPPGRYAGPGDRREAVEETDLHRCAKAAFAGETARLLNEAAERGGLPGFVLFADPRTLGLLREALNASARLRMLREIAADDVHLTVEAIERRVAAL